MGQFTQVERFGAGESDADRAARGRTYLLFLLALLLGSGLFVLVAFGHRVLSDADEMHRQRVASLEVAGSWQPQNSRSVWFATSRDADTHGMVDLFRLDTADGRCERILTRQAAGEREFSVSPSGDWVALAAAGGSPGESPRLEVIRVAGQRTWSRPLAERGIGQGGHAGVWTPDDRWLACSSGRSVLLFDTTTPGWLFTPEPPPSRSRQGWALWFVRNGAAQGRLFLVNGTCSEPAGWLLDPANPVAWEPTATKPDAVELWTRDGSARLHADSAGAWLEARSGKRASEVIHPPAGDVRLSPDGEGIYVMQERGHDARLSYMAFAGDVQSVGTMALWSDPTGQRRQAQRDSQPAPSTDRH